MLFTTRRDARCWSVPAEIANYIPRRVIRVVKQVNTVLISATIRRRINRTKRNPLQELRYVQSRVKSTAAEEITARCAEAVEDKMSVFA